MVLVGDAYQPWPVKARGAPGEFDRQLLRLANKATLESYSLAPRLPILHKIRSEQGNAMTTVNANVVIVDQTHKIDPALLHNAALALNTQVTQHLPKYWNGINASVSSAPSLHALPAGSWPVFLVESLPPGEGGFHLDKKNQPYAKVIASADDASWTIDASHEILEMLVDPYGNRLQSSQAIAIKGDGVVDAPGTFDYLVEACDPCEANNFGYEISGIAVSDFITPNFYDTTSGASSPPPRAISSAYRSKTACGGRIWTDPGQCCAWAAVRYHPARSVV